MIKAFKNIEIITQSLLIIVFVLLPVDNKILSPVLICLILLSLISFKKQVFLDNFKRLKKYYLPFTLLLFILSITILWTENVSSGMRGIERRILFILAPLIFLCIQINNKQFKFLCKAYVISTLSITSFFIIYGVVDYINIYSSSIKYPFYAFLFVFSTILEDFNVHRSYFSVSGLISIAIILNNVFRVRIIKKTTLLIFFSLSVLLFQSKVSIVILLSLLFVYWVHFIRNRNWKQRIVSIVIAIMVCIVSITIVKKRFDTMMRRLNNLDLIEGKGSTIERIQYYNSAKKLIQEKPFLGYGIGDVKDVMMIQINKLGYLNLIEKNQGDPHNEFLKVFLASGVIGLLFFIYLFYILFKYALKKKNYFMLGIFWIFFCNCLVESYLSRQAGIIPFLIFSCILLKLSTKNIEN